MIEFVRKWWAFAVLCTAEITALVLPDSLPGSAPTLLSLGAACAVTAFGWVWVALRQERPKPDAALAARQALAGVLFLCGPAVALFLRPVDAVGTDLLLAGCLVPVVVAVALATVSNAGLRMSTLWSGLAAVSGLLLLVVQPRTGSVLGLLTLLLLPLLSGVGAVLLSAWVPGEAAWRKAFAAGSAALVFLVAALLQNKGFASWSWAGFGISLAVVMASLTAITKLGPVRYSAYFIVLPLALLIYSFLVYRPSITVRAATGLLLLLLAAVMLLRGEARDDEAAHPLLTH